LKEIVDNTENHVRIRFLNEEGSHDWQHIDRVRRMALFLAGEEGGDLFIVEMAALLHDMEDWKLTDSETKKGITKEWLSAQELTTETIERILQVIAEVSFKGAGVTTPCSSLESMVVQDADRLDAIGAIGIARAFAYGGSKGRPLYLPEQEAVQHQSFESYKKSKSSTLHHFYEKLLHLKNRMNTATAIKLAEKRHQYMLDFADQFKKDWNF
jgi:uncharacterized protein